MLSPAEETFCQVLAQIQDACGAYRQAFLVPCALHSNTISREVHHLLDQPCVQNRIDELREEQAGPGDGPGDGAGDGDCSLCAP